MPDTLQEDPNLIYVRPAEGCVVMEAVTRFRMPDEGMRIDRRDPHWAAHLAYGDIEPCDAPVAMEAAVEAESNAIVDHPADGPALPAPPAHAEA